MPRGDKTSYSLKQKTHGNIAMRFSNALGVANFLSLAPVCHAEMPGKVDLQAAEATAGFIAAPVFALDSTEVGKVTDAIFDDEGRAVLLRMNTAAHLGLGTRRVEIPRGAFMVSRGAVVLELPAEAVKDLPERTDHSHDER